MEIAVLLATSVIIWMIWQLHRAKKFNAFKRYIQAELKPKVIEQLTSDLISERNDIFPNTKSHIDASIYYWGLYNVRILQLALEKNIIDVQWLKNTGKYRHCQHLYHIERQHIHESVHLVGESVDEE